MRVRTSPAPRQAPVPSNWKMSTPRKASHRDVVTRLNIPIHGMTIKINPAILRFFWVINF